MLTSLKATHFMLSGRECIAAACNFDRLAICIFNVSAIKACPCLLTVRQCTCLDSALHAQFMKVDNAAVQSYGVHASQSHANRDSVSQKSISTRVGDLSKLSKLKYAKNCAVCVCFVPFSVNQEFLKWPK